MLFMKRRKLLLLVLIAFSHVSIYSQVNGFEEYKNKKVAEYDEYSKSKYDEYIRYKDSINMEFASYLSKQWEAFNTFAGLKPDVAPKPSVMPKIDPDSDVQNELDLDDGLELKVNELIENDDVIMPEEYGVNHAFDIAPDVETNSLLLDFSNSEIVVDDNSFSNMKLNNVDEGEVSKLWRLFASEDYSHVIAQIDDISRERNLNDYAVYLLITQMSQQLFPDKPNEQIVYTVFLLNQLGFKAKIAKRNDVLLCLLLTKQKVYARTFLIFGTDPNERYYVFASDPSKVVENGSVYTYNELMQNCDRVVDLSFYKPILLGNNVDTIEVKTEEFGVVNVSISLDEIEFYKEYPHTVLQVYANADMNDTINDVLLGALLKQMEDLTNYQAANYLLDFVQESCSYMIDEAQFGYEKPFFSVERLYYPHSDCEDNAIFYSYLVRKLLGLDVVLLDYAGHVATAVKFPEDIGGFYIQLEDGKYIVCDPTYFGANVGMPMPKYRKAEMSVIELRELDQFK